MNVAALITSFKDFDSDKRQYCDENFMNNKEIEINMI